MRTYQKFILYSLVLAMFAGLFGCAKKEDKKETINKTNQTTSIETIANSDKQITTIETIIESDDQIPPVETIINSEHEKLVDYLTPKLKRVKESLYAELSKGNLGVIEYWQKTYQLLCEEGIMYEESTNFFDISSKLDSKLPIKRYVGVKKIYIGLEDVALSTEAQEDCDKYTKIKEMTETYLNEEIGKNPVLYLEFKKMVKNYLMKQNLQEIIQPEQLMTDLIFDYKNLKMKFNIIYYDPEMSGGYPPEVLEEALDNL